MNDITIAVLAGLGGMLGWGFADLFAKKTIDKVGDLVSLTWGNIFGVLGFLIVLIIAAFTGGELLTLPTAGIDWLFIAVFGLLQATVYYFVYKGFGKGQVAVLNPIFASFAGITVLISVIFFSEILSGGIVAGLATAFIGVMLMSFDFKTLCDNKPGVGFLSIPGLKEVGLATILAALWTVLWGQFIGGNSWLTYAFFMYLSMTLVTIMACVATKTSLKIKDKSALPFLALIGFSEVLAYSAVSAGYATVDNLSVIAVLSSAFSLPTILLARVFLKEHTTRVQLFASLVIVLGIILLTPFG